jgi:hypothetical protein
VIVKIEKETDGGIAKLLAQYSQVGVHEVDGWLAEPSIFITTHLDRLQRENHIAGAIGEIGVWRGKYLILLYLLARPGEPVVAVDSFVHVTEGPDPAQVVIHNVIKYGGGAGKLVLLQKDSLTLTPGEMSIHGRGKYRLFSVDGGHELTPVLSDLRLVSEVLTDGGVICMDDFFNSGTPGVIEGGFRFFYEHNKGRLAPFLYAANKLYITTKSHYSFYYKATKELLNQHADRPDFKRTLDLMGHLAAGNVKVQLFGHDIISVL